MPQNPNPDVRQAGRKLLLYISEYRVYLTLTYNRLGVKDYTLLFHRVSIAKIVYQSYPPFPQLPKFPRINDIPLIQEEVYWSDKNFPDRGEGV